MPASVSSGIGRTGGTVASGGLGGLTSQQGEKSSSRDALRAKPIKSQPQNSPSGGIRSKDERELYAQARHFFEPDYSMDSDRSGHHSSVDQQLVGPFDRVKPVLTSAFSDVSHEDSLVSSSNRSERSDSEASSTLAEPSESLPQAYQLMAGPPAHASSRLDTHFFHSQHTPTQEYCDLMDGFGEHGKGLPSLPSLASISPNVSPSLSGPNSPRGFASRHASRPRTADRGSPGSPNVPSPKRFVKGPPTPLKISRPMTSQAALARAIPVRKEETVFATPSFEALEWSPDGGTRRPSTTGSRLRSRALSTSKLRPTSPWKLFGVDMPVLPSLPDATTSGSSKAQVDGQDAVPKGRFRSRTLGEADRNSPLPTRPKLSERNEAIPPSRPGRPRCPSKSETLASTATSSAKSFLLASASSASPSVASTPKSPGRARAKSNTSGWASYLTTGLTLHIEQDGQRSTQVNMSYLSYDPFGSPEALVGGSEAKHGLAKRPKSRQDREGEASQVGTLEFGQGGEIHQRLWPFHSSGLRAPPILKHLTIGDDTRADLLTRQAALMVKTNGVHEVGGYERKGQLAWKFVYRVEDHATAPGDKLLIPISFSCSATLLDPARARKSRILTSLRKQVIPNLVSKSVSGSPSSVKQELPTAGGYVSSPPSSYRSQASLRREYLLHERNLNSSRSPNGEAVASPSSNRHRFDSPFLHSTPSFLNTPGALKAPLSANSIASTDSSILSASQPLTPRSGRGLIEPVSERSRLQSSPVSATFGRMPSSGDDAVHAVGSRRNVLVAETGRKETGHLGLDGLALRARQSSLVLQDKALMSSEPVTPARSIQTGAPRMIGGKKLIPISLPPELQKRLKIDPSQLLASATVARSARTNPVGGTASQSPSSSSEVRQLAHRGEERKPSAGRSRSHTTSPRPPTASEAIKLEYLAREQTPSEGSPDASPKPRAQRSHGTFVLSPSSAVADEATSRSALAHTGTLPLQSRRSPPSEGTREHLDAGRPFTVDAWGTATYRPLDAVRGVLQQDRPVHRVPRDADGPRHQPTTFELESSMFVSQSGAMAQAHRARLGLTGPRIAQAQNLLPNHGAHRPTAALVDDRPPRANA